MIESKLNCEIKNILSEEAIANLEKAELFVDECRRFL
jgi:hypothetical protein